MSAPDLSDPIRDALLASVAVTSRLPAYLDSFPIFTRRPSPANAPYPLVMVSQDITLEEEDAIRDFRPRVARDIAVYHLNDKAENYRMAQTIALAIWRVFNERRNAITVPDWTVVSVTALTPIAVDIEASKIAGRVVQLQVLLAARG